MEQQVKKSRFSIVKLEERIAPSCAPTFCKTCPCDPQPEPSLKGNNGWGNGEDAAPGRSGAAQPKFEDPFTGTSPSSSPASGGGNR